MDNIETIINDIINNINVKDNVCILNEIIDKKIKEIRYEIECHKIVKSNIYELYTLKRKIGAKMHLSFKYKCIMQLVLDRIEETLLAANNSINLFNSPKIIK